MEGAHRTNMDRTVEQLVADCRGCVATHVPPDRLYAAWAGGSLFEGLGNSGSDVDLFVLVREFTDDLPSSRRDADHWTYAFVLENRRFDMEFWTLATVDRLARILDTVPLDDPQVNNNHTFAYWETEFIHRLLTGAVLAEGNAVAEQRSRFSRCRFVRYLFEHCLRRFDDAFDDAVGMAQSEQFTLATLRARDAADLAMDLVLHAHGDSNDKAKFRAQKLSRLAASIPTLRPVEQAYWRLQTSVPMPGLDQERYVRSTLSFAADLAGRIQDWVAGTGWAHIDQGGRLVTV